MIKAHEKMFAVTMMCRVQSVSRSAYYAWRHAKPSPRAQANVVLTNDIKAIVDEEKNRVGAPRVTARLRAQGQPVGRHRVAKIMRKNGWRAKAAKKYKATTNSKHKLPVAPNLLQQNFDADMPNQKWVTDITYIWTDEGWLYLATVIDLYSRKVKGWAMGERITADLAVSALEMALMGLKCPHGILFHSDRGVQYASYLFKGIIEKNGMTHSMSRKADCWDNAVAESFFGTLKQELVHHCKFKTREEAKLAIFDYIEVFYNRCRLHSTMNYQTPESVEALALVA